MNEPKSKLIWSAKDEATLNELTARRAEVMSKHRQAVEALFTAGSYYQVELLADLLIENADSVRDALEPFDSRTKS